MRLKSTWEKWRWVLPVSVAAAVGAGGLALFRWPELPSSEAVAPGLTKAVTLISRQDTAVNDEAVLLDPTPLFLPTKWNAAQPAIAPREAGGKFQGFDAPKWNFAENDLKIGLPAPIAVPAGVAEAVATDGPTLPLVGLGRRDPEIEAMSPRMGFVKVFSANSGRAVLKANLTEGPPALSMWQPLEFIAAVDSAGLAGPLVLTVRSGVDEVDGFFADYLTKVFRLGERLSPGFYRISVGQ